MPACSTLSLPLIHATLGIKVVGPVSSDESSGRAIANFEYCEIAAPPDNTVTISLKAGVTPSVFKRFRSLNYDLNGQPTRSLSGLGPGAFGVTSGTGVGLRSTVGALKGGTVIVIFAPVSLGKVRTLAQKLLPKI